MRLGGSSFAAVFSPTVDNGAGSVVSFHQTPPLPPSSMGRSNSLPIQSAGPLRNKQQHLLGGGAPARAGAGSFAAARLVPCMRTTRTQDSHFRVITSTYTYINIMNWCHD